jgi:hypothetical protein
VCELAVEEPEEEEVVGEAAIENVKEREETPVTSRFLDRSFLNDFLSARLLEHHTSHPRPKPPPPPTLIEAPFFFEEEGDHPFPSENDESSLRSDDENDWDVNTVLNSLYDASESPVRYKRARNNADPYVDLYDEMNLRERNRSYRDDFPFDSFAHETLLAETFGNHELDRVLLEIDAQLALDECDENPSENLPVNDQPNPSLENPNSRRSSAGESDINEILQPPNDYVWKRDFGTFQVIESPLWRMETNHPLFGLGPLSFA